MIKAYEEHLDFMEPYIEGYARPPFGRGRYSYMAPSDNYFVHFYPNGHKYPQCPGGLKYHLAITEADLERALPIVGDVVDKYDVGHFKIVKKPFRAQSKQHGKEFTIYVGEGRDNPECLQQFLQELEERLEQAGIRPKTGRALGENIKAGDRPVNGSRYAHYRFDREWGWDNKKNAYDWVYNNKYEFSVPDGVRDPMPHIRVQSGIGHSAYVAGRSTQIPDWRNFDNWRVVPTSQAQSGRTYGYAITHLTPEQKEDIFSVLEQSRIRYRVVSVKSGDTMIKISESSQRRFYEMMQSYQAWGAQTIAPAPKWANGDNWVEVNYSKTKTGRAYAYSLENMSKQEVNELETYLKQSKIKFARDWGRHSSAPNTKFPIIRIEGESAEFFERQFGKAVGRYAAPATIERGGAAARLRSSGAQPVGVGQTAAESDGFFKRAARVVTKVFR